MSGSEARCTCCDLLVSSCGRQRPGFEAEADPYGGVLIERFLTAKYEGGRCALIDEHRISAGTTIGMAVYADDGGLLGWVCAVCVERITE